MDLSSATAGQKQIITTLDAPLSVAAGAGSGKTFTLTNRIAYALLGKQEGDASFIENVDEVLAITFSRSGAAELKSRIRSLLQAEGLDKQARAVEDAWITTIHGMCSRILREHALELGIDPAFEVIEEAESKELWQRALETVLERWADEDSVPRLGRLIEWFPPHQTGPNSANIADFLTHLWEKTLSMPAGFESVFLPDTSVDLAASLRTLVSLGEEFQAISRTWTKFGRYDAGYLEELECALAAVASYQQRIDLDGISFATEGFDIQEYLELALSFPKTSAKFRAKDPEADFFAHYRESYNEIAQALLQDAAVAISRDLLELLKLVDREYQALKGPGHLDNTDLLRSCCDALQHHSDLREAYQQQFKLIMVDEFQDTDLLQVAIINELSRNQGANVMTVGDAQQSIYRFRGADVEVFFRHRETQRTAHQTHRALSLPDNFRSHGDVLKFVDKIFSQPAFFGDEFLSLQAKGKVNSEEDPLFAELPRISVNVVENRRKGASANDVRVATARSIADHFAQLRRAGASPRNMVILLGSMSNVDIYSQALADAGFESVITAGSVFGEQQEVLLIEALLLAFADRSNSTALYQVLASPLFNLSDGALYAVAHLLFDSEKGIACASFAQRFWRFVDLSSDSDQRALQKLVSPFGLSGEEYGELMRTIDLMSDALDRIARGSVHDALYALILDSGWLYRLQESGAEGLAVSANVFKALGCIKDQEAGHRTLYEIADAFSAFLEVSKETPGVLATPESEFVRIMTIHASKGLEFDHVAIAEIRSGLPQSSVLRLDTYGDAVLFSLRPRISEAAKKTGDGLKGFFAAETEPIDTARPLSSLNAVEFSDLLDQRIERGELDDAQRLLYVALTRAVKSLHLCLGFEGNSSFNYEQKGMFGLLYEVLEWEKTPEAQTYAFDFGGSEPALVHHEVLLEGDRMDDSLEKDQSGFIFVKKKPSSSSLILVAPARHDAISYSSIAPDHGHEYTDIEDEKADEGPSVVAELREPDEKPDKKNVFPYDDEMFPEDDLVFLKQQSATALGTAFHRLAQRVIESRREVGVVPALPIEAVDAQVHAGDLSAEQEMRLKAAIERWLSSDLCARFMSHDRIFAEVPFMLELDAGAKKVFLEGEIDGLAFNEVDGSGAQSAFFIDYKTGGSESETEAQLHKKHLLQAQCYALALMKQGFETVEANFIRVERVHADDANQPQVVVYSFSAADCDALEAAVLSAYDAHEG